MVKSKEFDNTIRCCACDIDWNDRDICEVHGKFEEELSELKTEEELGIEKQFDPGFDFCMIHERNSCDCEKEKN